MGLTKKERGVCLKEVSEDELEEILRGHDDGVIRAALACGVSLSDIEEAYQGIYPSDEDFVQQLVEDTGGLPPDIPFYIHIDWEATARDVMMDYSEDNGHYFRNL